jgi:ribosomal protein L11 methyltransferase
MACTRAEAEALPDVALEDVESPPTVMVDEPDPAAPDDWVMLCYFDTQPDDALVARVRSLAPSASTYSLEPLVEADWVTMSQQGLEPVRAGRFVALTSEHLAARRVGDIVLRMEAGLAFGTGQHMTTHGCLAALDALGRGRSFRDIADLGTGTGILAFAAARKWRRARVVASDIDPVAVRVARENLAVNGLCHGRAAGKIELVTAAGAAHYRLQARARYDLICANILAGPLIAMSRSVSAALAPGGVLVLAGLLNSQRRAVLQAYRAYGLVPLNDAYGPRQRKSAEWPTLLLTWPKRS